MSIFNNIDIWRRNTFFNIFNKCIQIDVQEASNDILKLGLLQSARFFEEVSHHGHQVWLTYPHKMFQDCLAGYFCSKQPK